MSWGQEVRGIHVDPPRDVHDDRDARDDVDDPWFRHGGVRASDHCDLPWANEADRCPLPWAQAHPVEV